MHYIIQIKFFKFNHISDCFKFVGLLGGSGSLPGVRAEVGQQMYHPCRKTSYDSTGTQIFPLAS